MRASKRAYASNWPVNFYLSSSDRAPLYRERGIEGQLNTPRLHPLPVEKPTEQMVKLAAAAVARRDRNRDADRAAARDALNARQELELRRKANALRLYQFNNRWPD